MTLTSDQKAVLDRIDRESATGLLVDLVNIPSAPGEEKEIARYLFDRFEGAGIHGMLQEADQDRYNAVGIVEGDGTGLSLMFNGHLDTSYTGREKVGLKGGWGLLPSPSSGPRAVVEGDRIYGRGVYNMKGGVAAFVLAGEAIKKTGVKLRGDLILAGVMGEIIMAPVDEYTEPKLRGYTRGTHYLVTHGGAIADMAVVAEPTGSSIWLGHLGPQWVKISTYGMSANTIFADQVISPMDRMLQIIGALKDWIPEYQEKISKRYPYMNTKPVVRMGTISGGTPWRLARPAGVCSIYLDFRTKQSAAELKRDLVRLLNGVREKVRSEDPDFDFDVEFYLTQPGAEVPPEHPLVKAVEEAHRAVYNADPVKEYLPIDSDASVLTHFGIPALNYGPGPDRMGRLGGLGGKEFQNIDDVIRVARVFALTALDICGRRADGR